MGNNLYLVDFEDLDVLVDFFIFIFRERMCRDLFETITSYLVDLESMDSNDPDVRILLPRFKNIQARLKRAL